MEHQSENRSRRWIGRFIGISTVAGALVLLVTTIHETESYPRTHDATVRANFIEIVAEVSGRLVELPVKDNARVKKGDLLFAIDPRPYEYALRQALSDQEDLEQQIVDEQRKIAAQNSAVEAARALFRRLQPRSEQLPVRWMYPKQPLRGHRLLLVLPGHN